MSPEAPKMLSTFRGRDAELASLGGLFENCRVVTLTGAPGVGKTRLAREVSARWGGQARFVDLARVGDPDLVASAIASTLSAPELPGRDPLTAVVAYLHGRRLLLVLDNCEHLLGACRELVDHLRAECPRVLVLTTSREPLGVEDERAWPLAPLAVPAGHERDVPEKLLSYPAVGLFVERAGWADPGFALNTYVAPSVAEICRRLDGIPLAIELAATRVDMLTPAEIARRLDARFELLRPEGREAVARHRTLEAALDWSHDLLGDRERALLRRQSVFVGGFDPQAALEVCAGEPLDLDGLGEVLDALVSKSLVVADEADAGTRYRLLETVRAYAVARLEESGEAAALRERHAEFYVAWAEAVEPHLTGPGQASTLASIDFERENLRCALQWSLSHGHGDWSLRLAGAMVLFWRVRCHFSEGRELLEAALAAQPDGAPALRAKALWGAGFLRLMAGDPGGGVPLLAESLSLYRALGDTRGTARALLILANCNQGLGRGETLPLLRESAALARTAGDRWCLAHALAVAGLDHAHRSELLAARGVLEESLAVAREARDDQGLRIALIALGWVAARQGEYQEAETLLAEVLAIAAELEEDYSRATALERLSEVALGRGEYDRARALLEEAVELIPDIAPPRVALGMRLQLGRVAHAAGDRVGAHLRYQEAAVAAGSETPLLWLVWTAELMLDEGEPEEARRRLEEALRRARAGANTGAVAQALHALGRLARDAGDAQGAAAFSFEAMEIARRTGATPGVVRSIEALATLDPAAGGYTHSARLLGAAAALRLERGYARHAWEIPRHRADMAHVREALGDEAFRAAFAAGEALALEAAADEAVKRASRRGRPASGWPSLTPAEQRAAALVAEGLSNRLIAERLCISLGTVKAHLRHIFAKLGVTSRGELAVWVWRYRGAAGGQVPDEGADVAGSRNGHAA